MNNLQIVLIAFEFAVLLFSFSVHESAHAWVAAKLGDPTALMLGRVTLNPLVHIDPWGSLLMPLLCLVTHFPLIGYAKPCPVQTRNFKKINRDDTIVALAGPASNLLLAIGCLVLLLVFEHVAPNGQAAVFNAVLLDHGSKDAVPVGMAGLFPVALLLYFGVWINLLLFVFNLFPVPPLDGGRLLRNLLPYNAQQTYDRVAGWGFVLIFLIGGFFINLVVTPIHAVFMAVLGLPIS
jgi:Zn-dependent protease